MKRTSDISGTRIKSIQVYTTLRISSLVFIFILSVLGASFIVFGAKTNKLPLLDNATAYLLGILAIAAFLWLSALLASRFRTKKAPPKVRTALISTLRTDSDPKVRIAAAKGLAELDLEESIEHLKHDDLDTTLISTLKTDSDPQVRSAAAEGLAKLDLEQSSYYHEHNKLEDILFEKGQS